MLQLNTGTIDEALLYRIYEIANGEAEDKPLEVSITCTGEVMRSFEGISRAQAMELVKQQADTLQAPIMKALEEMEVESSETRQQPLSNSIYCTLDVDQIAVLSHLREVEMIRLVTTENVALSS